MIPYEVLVDALSAWKAQTAPRPQSPDAFTAEDTLGEDLAGEPPAYEEDGPAQEEVEMMDSEMVVLDEAGDGAVEAAEDEAYEMEVDEVPAEAGAAEPYGEGDGGEPPGA